MTRAFRRIVSFDTVKFTCAGVIVFIGFSQFQKGIGNDPSAKRRVFGWVHFAMRATAIAILSLSFMASSVKPGGPRRIEVTAKRFAFQPAEITVKKGEAIDLVLTSADVPHGIRIRELKIELHANKGKTAETTFTPQSTGTFVGHCSVFCGSGHGAMTLTIHVIS